MPVSGSDRGTPWSTVVGHAGRRRKPSTIPRCQSRPLAALSPLFFLWLAPSPNPGHLAAGATWDVALHAGLDVDGHGCVVACTLRGFCQPRDVKAEKREDEHRSRRRRARWNPTLVAWLAGARQRHGTKRAALHFALSPSHHRCRATPPMAAAGRRDSWYLGLILSVVWTERMVRTVEHEEIYAPGAEAARPTCSLTSHGKGYGGPGVASSSRDDSDRTVDGREATNKILLRNVLGGEASHTRPHSAADIE